MPEEFEYARIDPDWPLRQAAWIEHYLAKGCHLVKATKCADRKRHKSSWPSA